MATYSKQLLSGSTNGKNIKVASTTAGSGTAIHTAVAGTSDLDEVWIYASSDTSSDVLLTIEWGETTDPDGRISTTIGSTGAGQTLVIAGLLLQNGLQITAYADTINKILINGYVNRITA